MVMYMDHHTMYIATLAHKDINYSTVMHACILIIWYVYMLPVT